MISRTKRVTNAVVDTTVGDIPSDIGVAVNVDVALPDALKATIAEPTLDRYLDGNPKVINDAAAYEQLVTVLRQQRARDITAEAKKKAKKDGVEDDEIE